MAVAVAGSARPSTRSDIAKAVLTHRAAYNVQRVADQIKGKPGTIAAAFSLLLKAGAIIPATTNQPGRWYKTDEAILKAKKPDVALVKAMASQSGKRQSKFKQHLAAVIPPKLRHHPRMQFLAYVDFSQRALSVKRLARNTRQPIGTTSEYCQALVKAGLAEWVGNRVRKLEAWNLAGARKVLDTVPTESLRQPEAPAPMERRPSNKGRRERPNERTARELAAQGKQETPESMVDALDTLQEFLREKSLLELVRNYRELELKLAKYEKLVATIKAAGLAVPGLDLL